MKRELNIRDELHFTLGRAYAVADRLADEITTKIHKKDQDPIELMEQVRDTLLGRSRRIADELNALEAHR